VSFQDVKIGYVGESFQFSKVSYYLHDRIYIAITDTRHLAQEGE
jgi:hypothetical protein